MIIYIHSLVDKSIDERIDKQNDREFSTDQLVSVKGIKC